MAPLKIVTYNVRGLNSPSKRYQILQELKSWSSNIVFLQETHLKWSSRVGLSSKSFPVWFHGYSPNKRAKGIALGFDRNTPFILKAMESDSKGRYLFVRGSLFNNEYIFVNIYCPNIHPCPFLRKVMNKLERGESDHGRRL